MAIIESVKTVGMALGVKYQKEKHEKRTVHIDDLEPGDLSGMGIKTRG